LDAPILDLAEPTQYGPRGFGGGGSAAILLEASLESLHPLDDMAR
jgi:hypothetical protein